MPRTLGLRHIALRVNKLDECIKFYTDVLGMALELQTEGYAYLTFGQDNISLHQNGLINFPSQQRLEHFGFACATPEEVDKWHQHCKELNVDILSEPETFGIGTRGFTILDPSGNEVEFTYHPPMVDLCFSLCAPRTHADWQTYHYIRKDSIFDQINVEYDPNHPSLNDKNNYHYSFYFQNQMIGTLQLENLGGKKCSIRTIAIEKSQRNKGFGTILLKMAEEKARQMGAYIIHLHGNPKAKTFYLDNGYEEMEFPNDVSIYSETIDYGKHLK
ncbi:TPA: GNAT family N-acetyltransferase [Legionella pneumophila]